jgi:anti-anti-sigma regulatory factor
LQEREHALAVVADHPYAQRTFELTGLRETLRVSDTRDEAFARLGS